MTAYSYILFNKSLEQARHLGARGGRTYARNQRARRARLPIPPPVAPPRRVPRKQYGVSDFVVPDSSSCFAAALDPIGGLLGVTSTGHRGRVRRPAWLAGRVQGPSPGRHRGHGQLRRGPGPPRHHGWHPVVEVGPLRPSGPPQAGQVRPAGCGQCRPGCPVGPGGSRRAEGPGRRGRSDPGADGRDGRSARSERVAIRGRALAVAAYFMSTYCCDGDYDRDDDDGDHDRDDYDGDYDRDDSDGDHDRNNDDGDHDRYDKHRHDDGDNTCAVVSTGGLALASGLAEIGMGGYAYAYSDM